MAGDRIDYDLAVLALADRWERRVVGRPETATPSEQVAQPVA
jgi:hypothetical protein